ncbi:synemin [Genypterus blacodes]|uniref:synemin n=1 Tax=Genypterus blacodes TaxID=154954 RepID=UPI003F76982A
MLPFKRTFEGDKQQLQELNGRLSQYLTRTKQLEQENAQMITEINQLRQTKRAGREPQYLAEMRELRRMVEQLSFEKSRAEMEREKLWRELHVVQSLCGEQTDACRGISGELRGCESELHDAHKINDELQKRLFQLENEYKCMDDAHMHDMEHLQRQVESRMVPIVTQIYRGPPAASLEEVQEYARDLSQGWIETFDTYQRKVEEMEQTMREDQAALGDLRREKMLYASELGKLRVEAEQQGQIHMQLEEQLMHMQERFRVDFGEYQMIIEQLEHERNMMAAGIAEKTQEHQHLLQVKMDLGLELAAYRALLEGERVNLQDAHRRMNQHQRERIIDIKMPSQPYTQRASNLTRQHVDVRYKQQTSNLRRSPVPHSGSISPSRVIPISVTGRAQNQSPASRRDMISFTKSRAAASATTTKDKQVGRNEKQISPDVWQKQVEEKSVKITEVSPGKDQVNPIMSSTPESKSVRVVSAAMMSLSSNTDDQKVEAKAESKISQKKLLDTTSVEEIIEKVIKPAGSDAKISSQGEPKVTYHVEKTEQEDGTTKTQIVLESKVEEELDISEDSALDELLGKGMKKVSLEDIKDTATGAMIQNLLSGLQGGGDLQNKSVNVEIIEEPVESHSDEEYDVEKELMSSFYEPSSAYFQIEELQNDPHCFQVDDDDDDDDGTMNPFMTDTNHSKGGSVQVHEVTRESESSYFHHEREPDEYFVSTPDDNLSEPDEVGAITSYGHYGLVDDLSDERYYQDGGLLPGRTVTEEHDGSTAVRDSFPECIIEEEIHVSPTVQESMLEFLKEDTLEPKEQLRGALEKIQDSVSGPLKEELAFLTKLSGESPQNMAIDVKKVQQSSDNGTTTIVAQLNVSQSLEDSGLLEGDQDLSEEQIMAALHASGSGLEKGFPGGTGGYSLRASRDEEVTVGRGEYEHQGPTKATQEKRVATVYLEDPTDE